MEREEQDRPVELFTSILIGLGLAAACGFRVFVPLLIAGLAARFGGLPVVGGFGWLGSTPALVAFSVATGVEIIGYYVPWIDNLLDALATPTAIAAGISVAVRISTSARFTFLLEPSTNTQSGLASRYAAM